MKKRILSLALILAMMLSLIPFGVMTASAADDTIIGITWTGDGYKVQSTGVYPNTKNLKILTASGTTVSISGGTGPLCIDEDGNVLLETEPVLGEIYYFEAWIWDSGMEQNITNANSTIQYTGFSNGKVLSATTHSDGDIEVNCSIMYGELTGGVKAIASGVEYNSELGGYAPVFSTLKCVSTEGNVLEPTMVSDKYSYYGADSNCFYKTHSGISFSDKLTTEPQVGETYYSYFVLESMDGNLHIDEELLDIQIPGYDVEFIDAYERDMGFASWVVYSATKKADYDIYVGGVGMFDGDYLAVGATKTQTTKPSGGYAYYKNGKLTLNNYSYEGKGYLYNSSKGYYAVIYAEQDLSINLIGNNTLNQTESSSDMIYVDGANLTVGGDGKLTGTSEGYALYVDKDITINGGTVEVSTYYTCILIYGEVIINDGDITAESEDRIAIYSEYDITINGGNVTATGGDKAIGCGSSGTFSVAEGMNIQASTTVDGTLGEYVAANRRSYKKIVITTTETSEPDVSEPDVSEPEVSEPEVSEPEVSEPEDPETPDGVLGDVDNDGDVDAADYILVKRAVLKTYTLSEKQAKVADVDADGDVDATDYVLVKRIVLGTYKVK